MLKQDNIEYKEEYREILKIVELEVENILTNKGIKKSLGYIHIFDAYKKKILKEKYGIEWKTTQEMNPDILID